MYRIFHYKGHRFPMMKVYGAWDKLFIKYYSIILPTHILAEYSLLLRLCSSKMQHSSLVQLCQQVNTSRQKITSSLLHHIYTIYLFSRNDIKIAIGVGWLFGALNASIASTFTMGPDLSPRQIIQSTPAMLLWSWSHLFLFNLHNQRHASSIAEDAINKPWRPLPARRLFPRQATRIMYCMYPIVITLESLHLGGQFPSVVEMGLCLWYNEAKGSSNAFLKNVLNAFGLACFFAGPLEVATGHSVFCGDMRAATWLLILACAIMSTSHAQDFRDLEGDKVARRVTLPLLIGDMKARLLLAFGIVFWTVIASCFWEVTLVDSLMAWTTGAAVIFNLFRDKTHEGNTRAWKMFPCWLLGLFLLPIQVGTVLQVSLS